MNVEFGTKAICTDCGNTIVFCGHQHQWQHEMGSPQHIGSPLRILDERVEELPDYIGAATTVDDCIRGLRATKRIRKTIKDD